MKFKRDLIIVVLATFCLTASIFMVVPTRSNPTGLGEYDPWVDNNEDGAIDIFDAIGLAGIYGTSGDPTKSVNVMNWLAPQLVNCSSLRLLFPALDLQHHKRKLRKWCVLLWRL